MQWKLKMVCALTACSICANGMVSKSLEWETEEQPNPDDTIWEGEQILSAENDTPRSSKRSTPKCRADALMGTPTCGSSGFFITGSYLYWKAEQDGFAYTIKNHAPINISTNGTYPSDHAKVKHFDSDWAQGFQAAAGYHLPQRKWDLEVEWTQYQHNTKAHTRANSEEELFTIWMAPTPFNNNPNEPSVCLQSRGKWDLNYTILDLDLGRYWGISRFFSIRPHGGVRAAQIHQKFGIHYRGFPSVLESVNVKLKNNFQGCGIRAGLDAAWRLCRSWSIFCDTAYSLLWGTFDLANKEVDTLIGSSPVTHVNFKDHYQTFRSNLECSFGLRWDWMWFRNHCHWAISLGWTEILWFNQNQVNQLANAGNVVQMFKAHGDLGLSGAYVNARFDF